MTRKNLLRSVEAIPTTRKGEVGDRMVKRYPQYLRILRTMAEEGAQMISGAVLARMLALDPILVRKDLAKTGVRGTPRVGFEISELILAMEKFIGCHSASEGVLVGCGRLGSALLGYPGFHNQGFKIVAAFDSDPKKCVPMAGVPVYSSSKMAETIRALHVKIGIITVPASQAQVVADVMMAGGIRAFWNFSSVRLSVPTDVIVKSEDLAASLAVLSHRMRQYPMAEITD